MMGRNIQYFLRMAAMARSCSARSVRERALPSKVSPAMDSLIFGVFWTLRTHWRLTFELVPVENEPNRNFVWFPGLASIMGHPRRLLSGYPPQSPKFGRFHEACCL